MYILLKFKLEEEWEERKEKLPNKIRTSEQNVMIITSRWAGKKRRRGRERDERKMLKCKRAVFVVKKETRSLGV
jgi:hypothetical protein